MYTEINEEYVQEILKLSKEMFNGILYVKCSEHPCGWDSIDLNDVEDICSKICPLNISNGVYECHLFDYETLYEIIESIGMSGWSFVPPTICPDDFRTVGI